MSYVDSSENEGETDVEWAERMVGVAERALVQAKQELVKAHRQQTLNFLDKAKDETIIRIRKPLVAGRVRTYAGIRTGFHWYLACKEDNRIVPTYELKDFVGDGEVTVLAINKNP